MINALVDALMQRCRASDSQTLIQISETQGQRLTAAELWQRALEKRYFMRSFGMRPGDMWFDHSVGIEQMINLVACIQGSFHYCAYQLPYYQDKKLQNLRVFSQKNRNTPLQVRTLEFPSSLKWDDEFSLIVPTRAHQGGQSLPVRLDSDKILHQLEIHAVAMNIRPGSRRLISLPGSHSFGIILERLLGLYAGQDLVFELPPRLHPRTLLRTIQDESIDFVACVPEVLKMLLAYQTQNPRALDALESVSIHSGSAPWSLSERQRFASCTKEFFWSYGLTECGPGVLLDGKPLGCLIRLQKGAELPLNAPLQELWIATPSLGCFPGRMSKSIDGFFPSGDLAIRLADQRIDVLGRAEDLFLASSNRWLDRREIEQQLQRDYQLASAHISLNEQGDTVRLHLITADGQSLNIETQHSELEQRLNTMFQKNVEVQWQEMSQWSTGAWSKA